MSEEMNYQIVPEGKIRDYIDGTIRKDTPEEYVRQTVEKRLVIEHKYPKQRIAVEYPVKMGDGKKRADIVIFSEKATAEDLQDQQNIVLIIECKRSLSSLLTKEKECRSLRPIWLHAVIACGVCGLMASTKLFIRR